MSDLFEREEQQNFFQSRLPERPEDYRPGIPITPGSVLPETPEYNAVPGTQTRGEQAASFFQTWNEKSQRRQEFRDQMLGGPGTNLSMREYSFLFDMRENGIIDNDDIYKIIASKELGEYLGIDPSIVYSNYDTFWQLVSGDMENRYALPKSRWEAIQNSIQIARNMNPLGRMGNELQGIHRQLRISGSAGIREDKVNEFMNMSRNPHGLPADRLAAAWDSLTEAEKQYVSLRRRADSLWGEITNIQKANEELSRRMPKDALTFIATSTIQSAPFTLKSIGAGLAGGVVAGGIGAAVGAIGGGVGAGPGFAGGFRIGYRLGSFAASSSEMAGLMYVDLLAAGVEQENAARLAIVGGSINGFIESGLGIVAGVGGSAAKTIGGRVLSQEVRERIAEAASKNFIKRMMTSGAAVSIGRNIAFKTAADVGINALGEGLEEALQYMVEQGMLALGDAMQDAPVDRNAFMDEQYRSELRNAILGGIAGGIGFGIAGLPLTITGNVSDTARQTTQLKNLAITIDDKAEFRAAARENPLTRNLSDEQIDQMHDSQEGERQAYHQAMREEAGRSGHRYASMPTPEAPGEMRRQADGRLMVRITSPETADTESSGTLALFDPPTRQRMGSVEFSWDIEENAITIESIDLSQAVTDREAVIGDMVKELAYANPDMGIGWDPDERMSEAAGVDLSALKDRLVAENPRGSDWNLQFYQKGDRFAQTRAMNKDINLIASTAKVSRETASDIYEAWDTAFRNFGLDTHEMIGRMGLTSEESLRVTAAERPEGIEAQITQRLDQGKIAAQGSGQVPSGGMVVIRQDENGGQILTGKEALNEAFGRLRAVTVLTEHANPSTLHHEWLHFMTNVVIPNSPRYRALLEEAVGKKLEDFTPQDHERLAEQYEKYLRNGEAPTPGLKALFKRIAEALRQFVLYGNVSPELKEFFDRMLAGPDGAMLDGENRQAQSGEARSRARVQTDNEQQKAFAEMTSAQRILQSDLHTREEKAEIFFAMKRAAAEALENMEPIPVPITNITGTAAKETYKQIKQRQNKQTGQTAVFVNNSFDKTVSNKGFDKRVIPILAEAFENAVHMYDEPVNTAHKAHDNFTGYSHYVAKIRIDGQPVYARFTLENLKAKPGKTPVSQFHSVHLSYEVKNNAAEPHITSAIIKTATWGASGTTDLRLQQWLNFVKPNSENDMLFQTAYQGSPYLFDSFNNSYVGSGLGNLRYGWGHTFYSQKEAAEWFSQAMAKKKGNEVEGNLYEVDIPDDHNLLHWEKPISEQPEAVQKAADKLISWKKDGTSNFNIAYNLKQFDDRSYGFISSINGKMKWSTKAEAQAAAKEEIKKTLTGKDFYNALSDRIGAKRTSLLLDHLGVKGTKYLDKSIEKAGIKKGYNYVIYGDSDIQIMGAPRVESRALVPYGMLFQTVYHGSPYRFDRFDSSHMSSGEGNQAKGWGHYAASKKEVAEWYRMKLSLKQGAEIYVDGVQTDIIGNYPGDREVVELYRAAIEGELDNYIRILEQEFEDALEEDNLQEAARWQRMIEKAGALRGKKVEVKSGHLYEVDIPGDEEMLDWDKLFSEQPERVKEGLKKLFADVMVNQFSAVPERDGETLYNEIVFEGRMKGVFNQEQWASLLLKEYGIKGIRYLDGSSRAAGEGSYNYVIFDDNDIKIIDMLFQMTREDIHAEASRYSSWRKWMEAEIFAETQGWDKSFRQDNSALEPSAQQEIEAWYEKNWNEAQVLAREAALEEDGVRTPANAEAVNPELLDEEYRSLDWDTELYDEETTTEENSAKENENTEGGKEIGDSETEGGKIGPITTSEANRRLIEKLPRVIDDFLIIIGQTMRTGLEHFGAVTAEDVTIRDQIERDKERIYKEAHPYIRGLALRMSTGKNLNDTQRRTAMSHMRRSLESGATVYRELYTSLTEDQEFVSYAENEVSDAGVQGEAQRAAAGAEGLTAFQRTRLAEKIIDKDIRRKIRAGKAENGEVIDYLKRVDEEIREMDAEIKSIQAELEQSKGETAEERAESERWYRQYLKIRTELKAAKMEAEQINKKLEIAKQTKANAAERAKAGREKAETKLKEKLAAKQDEIRALRKRLKEDVSYARKQGRMEKAWKWAEERQKLEKKEAKRKKKAAEKKALNKYLETNKKIASWIMSADRIGMNVWVRQRELILGIQNALFQTSRTAAEARQYDAQIKDVQKKIEKEKKRLAREKDEQERALIQRRIDEHEAFLENLKSSRNNIEILGPYLSGVETEQTGEGADTVDTGTIVFNGKTMSVEEFRQQFFENKIRYGFMDSKLRKALRTSAPSAKSLGEKRKWSAVNLARGMSQEDLLAVKAVIQQLNKEGRANWERRQFAMGFHQQELIKTFLFQLDELEKEEKKTGPIKRYIKAMQTRDIKERKRLLAKGTERQQLLFMTFDDKRLVQWMDGDKKRSLYNFIIRERLRYANRRDIEIAKRTDRVLNMLGLGTPEQQAAEQNLKEGAKKRNVRERAQQRIKELGEKNITIEGVGPRKALREWGYGSEFQLEKTELMLEASTNIEVSLADLMFLSVALDNEFARGHYLFGNLWSDDERAMYENLKNKDGKIPADAMKRIKEIGKEKEKILREAIDQYLFEDDGKGGRTVKGELMRIVDAIRDDFEAHWPETRAVYEDMFNQAVEGQDNYLPIIITEGKNAQAEKQSEIEALTQGSYQVRINPDKGMMLCRIDIGPTHQTEIETDIFKVFFKGVEREEHFAKFAPYVRDINTVLRGRNNNSKQLAGKLADVYGEWAVNRLYQHINMLGLPPSAKLNNAWDNAAGLGRLLAGNTGVAYIAYNIPAWIAQYPNSIAAFFGKADARFILSACLEVMKPGNDLVERVFEKSPKVKQRVINVAEEYRKHLAEQSGKLKQVHAKFAEQSGKLKQVHAKFIEIGMMGQRHADKTMVAAGWWALYQTALKKGMSEEDAVVFADEITAETQPDLNALETSPMYKDQGLGGLFLRFTQPLNMVWQNLTYDSFISREKSFGSTIARITAYGVAALIVAAMRGGLAKKDDEDMDRDELMRRIFYYMVLSNFAESTPLIGNMVSGAAEKLVTGEGTIYQDRYFDLARRLLNIPGRLSDEDMEGAVRDAINALGLGAGLPVSQVNRIIKAVKEENPWIIFGFDPK